MDVILVNMLFIRNKWRNWYLHFRRKNEINDAVEVQTSVDHWSSSQQNYLIPLPKLKRSMKRVIDFNMFIVFALHALLSFTDIQRTSGVNFINIDNNIRHHLF